MLERLRQLREEAGVTQRQLAEAVSVSQQSINKYENHNIEPDILTLIQIADFFQTSVDYLVGHSDVRRRIESVQPYDLSEDEIGFVDQYRKLSDRQRLSVQMVIGNYLDL